MAGNVAPNIVDNGLVLYLDAANIKSYPTTGTTWADLSKSGYTGTLTNGPTFNSSNGGSIVFDGTNDYVNCGNLNINYTTSWSANVWFYLSAVNRNNTIIGFGNGEVPPFYYWMLIVNSSNLLQFWAYDGTNRSISDTNVLNINTWYNASVVYISGSCTLYLNGVNVANGTVITANRIDASNATYLGFQIWSGGPSVYMSGRESIVQIYNRALTQTEILQNYNTTKNRYI